MNFAMATDRAVRAQYHAGRHRRGLPGLRNTVNRARMDPQNPNSRPAPEGWRACLSKLCRARAMDLLKLAESLEPTEG